MAAERRVAAMEVEAGGVPQRKFKLEVDSDNKATEFRIFSFAWPHMTTFHLAWFSFFCCFVSTFATPPLLPLIRDDLNLTATDIGNAGIAAVSGAVFARLAMGTACDLVGPRLASASLIILTTPVVYCTALINSATGFFLVRFFTGFSLASFVSTQFWMSSMFSSVVVGKANGFAGGWGNLGGGATQLLMPLVFEAIQKMPGSTNFSAWRVAFFIPGLMQTVSAILVLAIGQDLPEGSYKSLHAAGEKHKDSFGKVVRYAVTNYRAWILALLYGYCFGVELTVDNIIAQYFYDQFGVNLRTAGFVAASFGMANIISRPGGGVLSDILSEKLGMRGRLWGMWTVQTLSGIFCVVLGLVSNSFAASVAIMVIFSFLAEASCGLVFGVVPFVSRRSLGLVSGMTGAGGNVGAVVTQVIFFRGSTYTTDRGITLMGIMIIGVTLTVALIHFPQWGSMFLPPSYGSTAEEYYSREWTPEEQANNYHASSMRFADNSVREGGKSAHAGSRSKHDAPAATPAAAILPPSSDA